MPFNLLFIPAALYDCTNLCSETPRSKCAQSFSCSSSYLPVKFTPGLKETFVFSCDEYFEKLLVPAIFFLRHFLAIFGSFFRET